MHQEIEIGAQRICLADQGNGTPVLLLHSSGMSSLQWRRLMTALEPRHRVLAPDFIGYGRSTTWAGPGDFNYSHDVDVAEAIARSAGAPVHLVGHSYGGFIALMTALRGNVPLASLSLFDPVAFGVLYSTNDRAGLEQLETSGVNSSFFAPEMEGNPEWSARFVDFWGGSGYWARLPEPMKATFLASSRKMFQEVRSLSHDRTPHQAYAKIGAPTLLLRGSDTPVAGSHVAEILARTMPHARLVTLQGVGHMGPLTHAAQVNELITRHIDAVDAGQ